MERVNINGYRGETIDIRETLNRIEGVARQHGWKTEEFFHDGETRFTCLRRAALPGPSARRIYISAGIHGDEPAGPLAVLPLLGSLPRNLDLWICPCLNPIGFTRNSRHNAIGLDLNREYLDPTALEVAAHIKWLQSQPSFDLCLLLHEDWESPGFYLYEQNPDGRTSLAERIIAGVSTVCPIDESETIEGRAAVKGIIRPNLDPRSRPKWPEAFFLITHKTRQSYTLEAPSELALPIRVNALVTAVHAALHG